MLVTPFEATEAYKLGIIDETGKNLIKPSKLESSQEKDAYSYLHRLVFNIKRMLNKLPGGESKIKNLVAALWLIKESYMNDKQIDEQKLNLVIKTLDSGVHFIEEEILIEEFFGEEGGIANVTGSGVSTDNVAVSKSELNKYKKKNSDLIKLIKRKTTNVVA